MMIKAPSLRELPRRVYGRAVTEGVCSFRLIPRGGSGRSASLKEGGFKRLPP